MIWHDILLMIGGFGFAIALLPSVLGKGKPARSTCAITGTILLSFTATYATLDLILATVATSITTLMWFILLFQRR